MKLVLLSLSLSLALALGLPSKMADGRDVIRMHAGKARKPIRESDRLLYQFLMTSPKHVAKRPVSLGAFQFSNCGDPKTELLVLEDLKVSPDPLPTKGTIKVSFNANVTANITSPVKTSLTIKKSVLGFWVEVPCVDDFGSCDYDDFCQILGKGDCPEPFTKNNVPCHCPFPQGSFTLPSAAIDVSIPSELPSGGYQVKIAMSQGDSSVGCYEVQIAIA